MRFLGGLVIAAPIVLALVAVIMPTTLLASIDGGATSLVVLLVAAACGASLVAVVVYAWLRVRLGRIATAAELIVAGDSTARVSDGRDGIDGRLARAVNSIATALEEARSEATTDRLTGVASRQALIAALFNEVERANRYRRPFSVAFIDIDHFKAVNDTYGHAAGDIVLRGVAEAIRTNLRASDLVGRYGGEEFMVLLAETDVEKAAELSEKLRQLVGRQRFAVEGNRELGVTISIGIAGGPGERLRTDTLARDADAAMYSAKALGRNQTYIFQEPDDDARVPRAPISTTGRARAVDVGRAAHEAAETSLLGVIAPLSGHRGRPSELIATIVVSMAVRMGLSEAEVARVRTAALLHDVGKIAIPEEILDKPSALTQAEWRSVVQHPRIGQVILESASALKDAAPIILHHHERYAGHGYPFGLRGNDIPLGARIVAIADAYDAMTNDRPYRRAMSHEDALREFRRHAGTQFDPELVAVFYELFGREAPVADPQIVLPPGAEAFGDPASGAARRAPRRRRRASDSGATAAG